MLTAQKRIEIVRNLLDSQDYALISEKELEKLASYILNGDPYFKAAQTHRVIEITADDGTSIVRKPDHFTIRKTQYYQDGSVAVYGHDWDENGKPITQLRDLWDDINRLSTLIKMYYCQIPPDEYVLLNPITSRCCRRRPPHKPKRRYWLLGECAGIMQNHNLAINLFWI